MKTKKNIYSKLLMSLSLALGMTSVANAQLYFSEYAEGSGYNKCVEIYACTEDSVDLSGWEYQSIQNGGTVTYTISLSSIQPYLTNGDVLVLCNTGASTNATLDTNAVDLFSNSVNFNGNDAIALYNTITGEYSDIFGDASSTTNFAKDVTLTRNCPIVNDTVFPGSNVDTNWTAGTKDDLSGFGSFDGCESCPEQTVAPADSCSDYLVESPIISGYLEGSYSNKCVEIYNPTCDTICLNNIEYRAYHNGATTPTYSVVLGSFQQYLYPGDVIVVCNPGADSIAASIPGAVYFWSGINHNGNDALELFNLNSASSADIFGTIGEDSTWVDVCGVGDTARAYNINLSRNVCTGVTTNPTTGFPTLCTQWDADTTLDTIAGLGAHSGCPLFGCDGGFGKEGSVEEAAAGNTAMSVYPNPVGNEATFEFQVTNDQVVTLEVYSITGNLVAKPFNGAVEAGEMRRVSFDVTTLPAGTYIYHLNAGDSSESGKFSVVK